MRVFLVSVPSSSVSSVMCGEAEMSCRNCSGWDPCFGVWLPENTHRARVVFSSPRASRGPGSSAFVSDRSVRGQKEETGGGLNVQPSSLSSDSGWEGRGPICVVVVGWGMRWRLPRLCIWVFCIEFLFMQIGIPRRLLLLLF